MINILSTQFFRLKKSKLFWAFLIVCAAMPIVSLLFSEAMLGVMNGVEGVEGIDIADLLGLNALTMLLNMDSLSADSALFSLICTAVVLCREFTQGTMRNAILANKSRKELYLSYQVTALFVGVCYYVTEFVVTLAAFGLAFGVGDGGVSTCVTAVLCHFAIGLCATVTVQTCVCMFMFVTRKMAGTIIFPLLFCLVLPGLVTGIITAILVVNEFVGTSLSETVQLCLPFHNLTAINPQNPQGLGVGMSCMYYLVMSAVFFVSGFFTFQKADLK